ncbi:unnamed protein product [Moneuplotes crassus]|uniref:Uncharacterized protein n=1 Tax=Euplotes crassus TaxID=5936 RepID=A0AAD1XB70_EUPCR|nr:unnamed protein product [Moneuplotes crassus]
MNTAFNYISDLVTDVKSGLDTNFDEENNATLIQEAEKVDTVLQSMNFCADKCSINFHKFSEEDARQLKCFNSCATKTFEVKQIESYNRSLF